jgi:hypothetical protein
LQLNLGYEFYDAEGLQRARSTGQRPAPVINIYNERSDERERSRSAYSTLSQQQSFDDLRGASTVKSVAGIGEDREKIVEDLAKTALREHSRSRSRSQQAEGTGLQERLDQTGKRVQSRSRSKGPTRPGSRFGQHDEDEILNSRDEALRAKEAEPARLLRQKALREWKVKERETDINKRDRAEREYERELEQRRYASQHRLRRSDTSWSGDGEIKALLERERRRRSQSEHGFLRPDEHAMRTGEGLFRTRSRSGSSYDTYKTPDIRFEDLEHRLRRSPRRWSTQSSSTTSRSPPSRRSTFDYPGIDAVIDRNVRSRNGWDRRVPIDLALRRTPSPPEQQQRAAGTGVRFASPGRGILKRGSSRQDSGETEGGRSDEVLDNAPVEATADDDSVSDVFDSELMESDGSSSSLDARDEEGIEDLSRDAQGSLLELGRLVNSATLHTVHLGT